SLGNFLKELPASETSTPPVA
ncbi:hypothetical protein QT320_29240, partial [Klebsiella pneumoniae]